MVGWRVCPNAVQTCPSGVASDHARVGADTLSIRERNGRYQARLTIQGRALTETFDTPDEAEEWELVTRARSITGTLPRKITVAEYSVRWLDTYDGAPANTIDFYRRHLQPVLTHLGSALLPRVTPSDISTCMNRIRAERGVAAADRCYRTLSALFGAAYGDSLIDVNPVRSKKHRPKRQPKGHVVLERPEARRVLLQLGGWKRDHALLQLSLGPRYGEVAGLTRHDVDLRRRKIHVVRRYSEQAGTIRATKNHRRRTLEIPEVIVPTLERLLDESASTLPIPDLGDVEHDARRWDGHWLVQTSTGRPPNLSRINAALKKACVAAGVPRVSSHGLRHTYVSWMIDDGHSADKIAFWIGDTPETVRRVYSHELADSSAPAARSIDAALDGIG